MLGIGNRGVRAKFRRLESEKEEFETSSRLGIGNGRVLPMFEAWIPKWRSSIQIITLGIGNGGVRANVRSLETEIETLELSSEAWNWGIEELDPSSNLARTLPFPIPSDGTLLKLLHFRFQASNLAGATILITSYSRNFFIQLAGGSRVYVSRAILIKCEPTSSNSALLQVSNYNSGNNYLRVNRQLSETDEKITNR